MIPLSECCLSACRPLQTRFYQKLSGRAWTHASPDSHFHVMGKPEEISKLTTVRALYDDTFLYLLFECRGKPAEELIASTVMHDGEIWKTDDDVEFFFFTVHEDSVYVRLLTNPIGAKSDLELIKRKNTRDTNRWVDYVWSAQPGWF